MRSKCDDQKLKSIHLHDKSKILVGWLEMAIIGDDHWLSASCIRKKTMQIITQLVKLESKS